MNKLEELANEIAFHYTTRADVLEAKLNNALFDSSLYNQQGGFV